nr:PREDICTED: uncharacterized protein LOC104146259 [Struthio camelus australis]
MQKSELSQIKSGTRSSALQGTEPAPGGTATVPSDSAQLRIRRPHKTVINPKEQATQTEPVAEVSSPPRANVGTQLPAVHLVPKAAQRSERNRRAACQAAAAAPRCSPSPPGPHGPVRPNMAVRPNPAPATGTSPLYHPMQHSVSNSSYRCRLHQTGGLSHGATSPLEPCSPTAGITSPAALLSPQPTATTLAPPDPSAGGSSIYRAATHPEDESEYRCAFHQAAERMQRAIGSMEVDSSHRSSLRPALACSARSQPLAKDKCTQTKFVPELLHHADSHPKDTHAHYPCWSPALTQPEFVSRDLPARALPKLGPNSAWWSLLQPDMEYMENQTPVHLESPVMGNKPSNAETFSLETDMFIEVVAKGTAGSSKDVDKPMSLGRASATILLHEVKSESFSSSCEAEEVVKPATETTAARFSAFFVGKFGQLTKLTGAFLAVWVGLFLVLLLEG